jgi:hypothetical protein
MVSYLAYDVMDTNIHDEKFISLVLEITGMDRMVYEAIMFEPEREE